LEALCCSLAGRFPHRQLYFVIGPGILDRIGGTDWRLDDDTQTAAAMRACDEAIVLSGPFTI
jgi:hypothetical protein